MDNEYNTQPMTIIPQTKFCAETAKIIVALAAVLEADLSNSKYSVSTTQARIQELLEYGKLR